MAKSWYAFMGGESPIDPTNYYIITVTPTCICGEQICAIYADSTEGNYPLSPLSENIVQYINRSLVTFQMQPEEPYASRKYVYLRHK